MQLRQRSAKRSHRPRWRSTGAIDGGTVSPILSIRGLRRTGARAALARTLVSEVPCRRVESSGLWHLAPDRRLGPASVEGLRRLGTEGSQTPRWREVDSNPRSPRKAPDTDAFKRRCSAPVCGCRACSLGASNASRRLPAVPTVGDSGHERLSLSRPGGICAVKPEMLCDFCETEMDHCRPCARH